MRLAPAKPRAETTAVATHLEARGLSCAIGGRTILSGIDLDVAPGEMIGLLGANGSGKSTLLRTLAGLTAPVAGTVCVGGVTLGRHPARRRARLLAFVGQEEPLPPDLRAGELVALGLVPHRAPWAGGDASERASVAAALADVGLAEAIDCPVDRLSGGERRRVSLARGLAQRAPLLLLDEPTNHLDVRHQLELMALTRGLGRTVVVALHDLDLAVAFCDRVLVLHAGGTAVTGPPADVLTPGVLRDVFGVSAARVVHPETGRVHLLVDSLDSPYQELPR